MNYYKRHLGDYARDTGHLTALEHGIYNLLLDAYYSTEKAIPAAKAPRIAKANPEETQMVLQEFFKLTPEGWIHSRADREIQASKQKTERNREIGKLGGRPRGTQTLTHEEPKRLVLETPATSHKPLAITKEKEGRVDLFPGVPAQIVKDWKAIRKLKKLAITETAMATITREAEKAGMTLAEALTRAVQEGWGGFKAEWLAKDNRNPSTSKAAQPALLPTMEA